MEPVFQQCLKYLVSMFPATQGMAGREPTDTFNCFGLTGTYHSNLYSDCRGFTASCKEGWEMEG